MSLCPACGQPIDYCRGHGEIGDPIGHRTLQLHDIDNHARCHPDGCEALRETAEDALEQPTQDGQAQESTLGPTARYDVGGEPWRRDQL